MSRTITLALAALLSVGTAAIAANGERVAELKARLAKLVAACEEAEQVHRLASRGEVIFVPPEGTRTAAPLLVDDFADMVTMAMLDGSLPPEAMPGAVRQLKRRSDLILEVRKVALERRKFEIARLRKKIDRLSSAGPGGHSSREAGRGALHAGDHAEAERAFRDAIHEEPARADLHRGLGNALDGQGRHEEAAAAYRRAIELAPEKPGAHADLAGAIYAQGRRRECLASLDRALELGLGEHPVRKEVAAAQFEEGRRAGREGGHERAAEMMRRAVRYMPDEPKYRNGLGNELFALHRYEEAAACYREAIRLEPERKMAHANLAGALFKQGRREEARQAALRAIELGVASHWVYGKLGLDENR